MAWLQKEVVVISETEKSLTDLRAQLDIAVSAEDVDKSRELVMNIYELLDTDPHITWKIVESSKVNKAVGQLQKSAISSTGELKRQTEKLFQKLRKISDWAKGGGYMGDAVKVDEDDDREVAHVKAKQVGSEISAQQAWHSIPAKFSSWRTGPDGRPARIDVPEDDPHRMAMVGDAGRARVEGRVSVVVATTADRYRFHGQLWLCYQAQMYQDKELIIVDSGERRSPFFGRCHSDNATVKYVHVTEPLSVGEKRNLAIREYSTGEMIANFDDDDVYFPSYLAAMVKALKTSKSALFRLTAWNVLDLETQFCAHFNSAVGKPSEEEALALAGRCGFSMVYTYAAWRSIPWPHWTIGEDEAFLSAFTELDLPVAGRAEPQRGAMLVLKTQHGRNMQRSVCHTSRRDVAVITAAINRFEEACRRMAKVNAQEYSESGETMLFRKLLMLNLNTEQPESRGLYVLDSADFDLEHYRAWQTSVEGTSPDLAWLLQRQAELRNGLATSPEQPTADDTDTSRTVADGA